MGECRNTAIVLAAGQGKRMHSKIQKQFMELDGMPVLCYSLRRLSIDVFLIFSGTLSSIPLC